MIYDYGSDRENDGSFDVKKFYSEILALYPDSDSKCMEPSARFEDLLSRCSQSFGYIDYIKSIVLLAKSKSFGIILWLSLMPCFADVYRLITYWYIKQYTALFYLDGHKLKPVHSYGNRQGAFLNRCTKSVPKIAKFKLSF